MQAHIRPENPIDIPVIEQIITQAFALAEHTSGTEAFIVRALRNAQALSISIVAEVDQSVVAYLAVSPVFISSGDNGWYGLGPIAVLPSYQGKGIGSRLLNHALDLLRDRDAAGCVVLGEPAYYGRFGFTTEPSLILPGVPPEYFQAIRFTPNKATGNVTYHDAFAVTHN